MDWDLIETQVFHCVGQGQNYFVNCDTGKIEVYMMTGLNGGVDWQIIVRDSRRYSSDAMSFDASVTSWRTILSYVARSVRLMGEHDVLLRDCLADPQTVGRLLPKYHGGWAKLAARARHDCVLVQCIKRMSACGTHVDHYEFIKTDRQTTRQERYVYSPVVGQQEELFDWLQDCELLPNWDQMPDVAPDTYISTLLRVVEGMRRNDSAKNNGGDVGSDTEYVEGPVVSGGGIGVDRDPEPECFCSKPWNHGHATACEWPAWRDREQARRGDDDRG